MTPRILLADNNIAAQTMGMKILAAAGYDVVTLGNGVAVLKKIAETPFDLVVLDVYLPGRGGIEICEMMKATPEMAQILVLLTAGRMDPFRAEDAIKAKADGFIIKPFEASHLIPAVERLVERVRPSRQRMKREFQLCNKVCEAKKARLEPTRSETHAARLAGYGCDLTVPAEKSLSALLRERGSEVCDVCGWVNREDAFACQQCDVPLPSSVIRKGSRRIKVLEDTPVL